MSAIITLPITPNHFWGVQKRNLQETWHVLVFSISGKITPPITPKKFRESVVVINLTSVTPENSWGICCVMLKGPMAH